MCSARFSFNLETTATDCGARVGTFHTAHGSVTTPVFMPVATHAAIRSQDSAAMRELGAQVLLANTYHLLLRPGAEVFRKLGGIHRFMNWDRPVLTDSGGFQIFSLSRALQMSEEGAEFRSYVNGDRVLLTPERSIEMQRAIGSDIMMVLDQCIPSTSSHQDALAALELTFRWAKRSLAARADSAQALFGIVQGACYEDLRRQSAAQITSLPFDGYAIGGLAVGESKSEREDMCEYTLQFLPRDKPRYLMGVGTPADLLEAVKRGVDMFDCILPTALGGQGVCYTSRGKIDLRRGTYRLADEPLDALCQCSTCKSYSRAYLHHLSKTGEFLCAQLVGVHNFTFYLTLMAQMRRAISAGTFMQFYAQNRETLLLRDLDNPSTPPKRSRANNRHALTLGDYEVVTHEQGWGAIRQKSSGEVMHSVIQPQLEAERLYLEQSGFRDLVRQAEKEELVLWDVGLGAATNAMSVVHAYEELSKEGVSLRPVKIVSFEQDLDSLRLALLHPGLFKQLCHQAPHCLLKAKHWQCSKGPLSWELLEGDFLQRLEQAAPPQIIFYDPFSYKTDSVLWNRACFGRILACCAKRSALLFTYSTSTAVRSAMLAAGFFVGRGVGTGPKDETTVALSEAACRERPDIELLEQKWLERWERSDAKTPPGLSAAEKESFGAVVRGHKQFKVLC